MMPNYLSLCVVWFQLYSLQKVVCEMELLPAFRQPEKNSHISTRTSTVIDSTSNQSEHSDQTRLLLQGQLRYLEEWEAIIYLCNPL